MIFAFLLTFLAGAATIIGGIIATQRVMASRGFLAAALGFSAGAMLYVSFTDILAKSFEAFNKTYSEGGAYAAMIAAFFFGLAIMVLTNRLIPSDINLNDQEGVEQKRNASKRKLMHSGVLIAVALCLHNFPEGFLVFMTALDDPDVGFAIAIALAIHNIPEGIAVAAPLYAATKKRFKSIAIAGLTGIAEPIGALIGFLLLRNILTEPVFGIVFGVVAGMMVFICIDELLPAAKRYETNQHQTTYGFIGGMGVLAISLMMLQ